MSLYTVAALAALCLFITGCADDSVSKSESIDSKTYEEIEALAKGSTVRFYMWGGSAQINAWVDGYVAKEMKLRHDITVERIPMDASVFVNKLLTEKAAGKNTGTIDVLWINGENFRNAREGGVLYGPFADKLPNMKYVDASSAATDFGYPVNGYEAPYGRAQFVFEYDSARISSPPRTFAALKKWIMQNPGRFTYPQPPDFTGSAFLRQVLYAVSGGYQQFMGGYDEALWAKKSSELWRWLNDVKPFLWQQGVSQPKDPAALDTLFARGEVDFNMAYHPSHAQSKILEGTYPDTVRTFVLSEGSIFNTHFTAIAFNAPNKAGAMVLSNFLLSPEAQAHKFNPENWGDYPVVESSKLAPHHKSLFNAVSLGKATLSPEILASHAVPEIPSTWLEAIEAGWDKHVLRVP
ncbi:ABC transporter substrate-binding protein [Oleidesulfovibrio sp.]|uniref:ABC transporter substrate-binding protein n=1 Tax=Oleidesulfovibrio sp. TaxID=2909707 RepID=UPI003A88511A